MINKVLIANRGEIATRIIRTCKNMGIQTVAVYSEADQQAPFVQMADESYLLGAPPVNESYLNTDKIMAIAKKSNAQAIHPGYGLLSENKSFAEICEQNGMIFIGPNHHVIDKMGDKVTARKLMQEAGITVIPGTDTAINSMEEAIAKANQIGYPIMVKAAAGGGGIGMQKVNSDKELESAFISNSERAKNFFGDGSIFLEKKLENVRHIEVQILADHHGNVVHLFDRECSIQRRNQKVIEEAPSAFISEKTRQKICVSAVRAALAINYTNAGTIEFLVDENESFYFLEMNTRIQVEHTITEEITGIDIVEQQLLIASGHRLTIKQQSINKQGHAIEVRIYAEDPKTFFPSPGRITKYSAPKGKNIRHETAVANHVEVTPFYDPMISKLIIKDLTRKEAINRLRESLLKYKIEGIKTNIPMLLFIIDHKQFNKGNITTSFVENYYKINKNCT